MKLGKKSFKSYCARVALIIAIATLVLNGCLFIAVMRLSTTPNVQPLVNTIGCVIPYVDPFEAEILSIVQPNTSSELHCSERLQSDNQLVSVYDLTYAHGLEVCVNQSVNETQYASQIASCAFFAISREEVSGDPDYVIRYSK